MWVGLYGGISLRRFARLCLIAAGACIGLACLACAGEPQASAPGSIHLAAPGLAAILFPAAPSKLPADAAGQLRLGREYSAGLPQAHVAEQGDDALFSPLWFGGPGQLERLAYATYQFDLTGYTGPGTVRLSWTQTGDFNTAWLGLAHWGRGRWDWRRIPAAARAVSTLDVDLAPYIDPADGRLLALVAFNDATSWQLAWIEAGQLPGAGWVHTWGGELADDAYGAAVDAADNLYVVGSTKSYGAGKTDVLLLKYSPLGELLWAKAWGTADWESALAVDVDTAGDVYVVGAAALPAGKGGALVLRFSADSALVWSKVYGIEDWWPGASAVDAGAGGVAVLGSVATVEIHDDVYISQDDLLALRLNADGLLSWASVWGQGTGDMPGGVVADESGGCYASGTSFSILVVDDPGATLLKFSNTGTVNWAKRWNSGAAAQSFDLCFNAAQDRLLLGGVCRKTAGGDLDGLFLEFNLTGTPQSAVSFASDYDDYFYGIAATSTGWTYLAGTSEGITLPYGNPDGLLCGYNAGAGGWTLSQAWGSGSSEERFHSVTADSLGAPYLVGNGETPGAGNWLSPVLDVQPISGSATNMATTLKDFPGVLHDVLGTLQDVTGIVDGDTGDTGNALACKIAAP